MCIIDDDDTHQLLKRIIIKACFLTVFSSTNGLLIISNIYSGMLNHFSTFRDLLLHELLITNKKILYIYTII